MTLYQDYRPSDLNQVWGQEKAVGIIGSWFLREDVPHAILLTGPSGTGKTTLGRIIARMLKVNMKLDFTEKNTADFRGIDTVREIRHAAALSAHNGGNKLFLIDECHQLTSSAQDALLKTVEDAAPTTYFVFCTTLPKKITKTLKGRLSPVDLNPVRDDALKQLMHGICKAEKLRISESVLDAITDNAGGSAREALVLLDKVSHLEDEESMLEAIEASVSEKEAVDIARQLFNPKANWKSMANVLKALPEKKVNAEGIRQIVLAYASKILLDGGKNAPRAADVIAGFSKPIYDPGVLYLVCYDLLAKGK